MISFSARFTFIFLLAVNIVFLLVGIQSLIYGIYKKVTTPATVEDLESRSLDGTLGIVTGTLDIVIGVCGIVAAVLKNRILLIVNSALIGCALLGNIVMIIMFSVTTSSMRVELTNSIRGSLIKEYGSNHSTESVAFTTSINKFHISDGCCGWSGTTFGENLYILSPWFNETNPTRTVVPISLPDSCCITTVDECRRAQDMKQAKENGFVKFHDCLDNQITGLYVFVILSITKLVIVCLLQASVVAFLVLIILQDRSAAA